MVAYLFVITTVAFFSDTSADLAQRARKLERHATESRQLIHNGIVEFDVVTTFHNPDRPGFDEKYTISFDGENRRIDHKHPLADGSTESVRTVFTDEHFIQYHDDISDDGRPLAAVRGKKELGQDRGENYFDPRVLGVAPVPMYQLRNKSLNDVLGRADATVTSVAKDMIDGIEAFRIVYFVRKGREFRVWIAPSRGYSVVRSELHTERDGLERIDRTTGDVTEYPGGIWYPKKVAYERWIDGKLVMQQAIVSSSVQFNDPIAPETFGLAGMRIPPGTELMELPPNPKGARVWDGKKLVPAKNVDRDFELFPEPAEGHSQK